MDFTRRAELTRNALLGQAVGDAFGVPVEFLPRVRVRALDLREMVGAESGLKLGSLWGDRIPAGCWSDDTSMTVASMASFIRNGGKIDYEDQMRQFMNWWDGGEYCSIPERPFGLGGNVGSAMERFREGTPALECGGQGFRDNGNGALMRILPFSLYCIFNNLNWDETVKVIGNGSAITHGHEISRLCCFIWTEFLRMVSMHMMLTEAAEFIGRLPYRNWFSEEAVREVSFVTEDGIQRLREGHIGETGYVVDTLYAALFSMVWADSYEQSIRSAVSLGYDTDTAGAVTGAAAGIRYGAHGISERWLSKLKRRDYLEKMAADFAACFGE